MADATQTVLTVGMPTLAVLVGILVNNARLSDLRGYIDHRFDALQQILNARFAEQKAELCESLPSTVRILSRSCLPRECPRQRSALWPAAPPVRCVQSWYRFPSSCHRARLALGNRRSASPRWQSPPRNVWPAPSPVPWWPALCGR